MAIAYRSQTSLASASRTTTTVNMPAGVQAGDVVLIWVSCGGSTSVTPTAPGTVTAVTANFAYSDNSPAWTVNTRVWRYVVVGSGDPSSFAFTHSSIASEAVAIAFSGVDTTTPIDATPTTNGANNAGSTTATALGVTTTVPGAELVVFRGSWDGNAITPPSGFTERLDQPVTWVGTQNMAAAGATGNFVIPTGNGGSSPWACVLVPLRPAGGSSPSVTPADNIGITDSAAAIEAFDRTQGDPLGLTDSAQTTTAAVRSAADPVGLTDTLQASFGASVAPADPLGISDATTLARSVGPADPVGATDSVGIAIGAAVTDDDPVGVTDNVAVALSIARSIGETVGVTDGASVDLTSPGSAELADPLGVTDLLATTAQILRTAGDSLGITDGVTVGLARTSSPSDPVGIGDSVTAQTGAAPSLADSVGVSDSAVAVLSRVVTIAEQVAVTDVAGVFNPAIPPLPIDGVSLTVSADTRSLTLTAEARDLEVST